MKRFRHARFFSIQPATGKGRHSGSPSRILWDGFDVTQKVKFPYQRQTDESAGSTNSMASLVARLDRFAGMHPINICAAVSILLLISSDRPPSPYSTNRSYSPVWSSLFALLFPFLHSGVPPDSPSHHIHKDPKARHRLGTCCASPATYQCRKGSHKWPKRIMRFHAGEELLTTPLHREGVISSISLERT